MKRIILSIIVAMPYAIFAQETVILDSCLDAAVLNHPRQADFQLIHDISDNRMHNYSANWYPQLDLNGTATYQSDVINFNLDIPVPGFQFPTVPKDQYKVSLDVSQTIYDAGMTRKQKEVERADVMATQQQLKSDIEKEKDLVKDLFYSVIVLRENIRAVSLSMEQVRKGMEDVRSAVDHGVMTASDLNLLKVEEMKLLQNQKELENRRAALVKVLSDKTGIQIVADDSFVITSYEIPHSTELKRTELEIFDSRRAILGKSADLVSSKRLPVFYAFGQFGYGKPGLNMLNDQFDTYYLVGAGLKWKLWDWNTVKRERENLHMQSEMLGHQKQNFEMNIDDALTRLSAEIQTHSENIASYSDILSLRENITAEYHSKLKNGTIRTSEYLEVLNQEKLARIKLMTEKVLLQKAIADYRYTEGSL
jgi:outer membrane protein TolC